MASTISARLRTLLTLAVAVLAAGLLTAEPAHSQSWSREERALLDSLRLSGLPVAAPDPSNRYEGSAAAVELGRRLFFDTRFSRNGQVACASCHDPERQFQDGRAVGRGIGVGTRRAMPIVGAGHGPWLFWDGRKDSLWSQALGPLEDAVEQGGNRVQFAHLLQAHYRQPYEALFGPLPDLGHLPADAGPLGTEAEQAAWRALDERSRDDVSRVFANLGKAMAAYEKSLRHSETRLDRYLEETAVRGRSALLDAREASGLRLFIGKGQCVSCHNGPLLSDQQFHNTGIPQRDVAQPDRGRAAALAKVVDDEFNCLGRYSDAGPGQCQELRFMVKQDTGLEAAFKTPSLRGVADRPPYMHAGQLATLDEVVRHYVAAPHAQVGQSELHHLHGAVRAGEGRPPIVLTDVEQQNLVAFLRSLSALPQR